MKDETEGKFSDEWKAINDAAKSNSENYDRGILTAATISLTIGLAFTKELAPNTSIYLKMLLIGSWISLVLSIACVLYSYRATDKQIALLRRMVSVRDNPNATADKNDLLTLRNIGQSIEALGVGAGAFLAIGLVASLVFGSIKILGV